MYSRGQWPRLAAGALLLAGLAACRPQPLEQEYIPRTEAVKLLREAAEAFAAGNTAKALVKAQAAVEEDPGYYLAHSIHSMLLGHEGDAEGAAEAMSRALEIFPEFAKGHLILGVYEERLGNEAEATQSYEKAIALFDEARAKGTDSPVQDTYRAVAIYLTQGRVRGQAAIDQILLAHRDHPLASAVRENMRNEKRSFFLDWATRGEAQEADSD